MSFKTKSKKKLVADTRVTLQAKHELKVSYFTEKRDNINTQKRDLDILESRLLEYTPEKTNDFNIDKNLIGGLKIKVDDTLYDSSLQTKLENAKSKLIGV